MATTDYFIQLDIRLRRYQRFLNWMINGQFQHGIYPGRFPDLTPERVEELYNVNFGN